MKKIYEINALLEESGKIIGFHLSISTPLHDVEGGDFYCKVHCPALFRKDRDIYSVDEAQAMKLAAEFANRMLSGKRLFDTEGKPIDFVSSIRTLLTEPNQ